MERRTGCVSCRVSPVATRQLTQPVRRAWMRLYNDAMKPSIHALPAGAGPSRAPALLFVGLALLGGAAMLVLLPPMQAPEEASHFARAYQVADGGWLPQRRHGETGG